MVLIDVRTKDEWREGHAKDALHFEIVRLARGEMPDIPKDTEIKTYCNAGGRAGRAKNILLANGFTNVESIGGIDAAAAHAGGIVQE